MWTVHDLIDAKIEGYKWGYGSRQEAENQSEVVDGPIGTCYKTYMRYYASHGDTLWVGDGWNELGDEEIRRFIPKAPTYSGPDNYNQITDDAGSVIEYYDKYAMAEEWRARKYKYIKWVKPLKNIGQGAFYGMTELLEVDIPAPGDIAKALFLAFPNYVYLGAKDTRTKIRENSMVNASQAFYYGKNYDFYFNNQHGPYLTFRQPLGCPYRDENTPMTWSGNVPVLKQ